MFREECIVPVPFDAPIRLPNLV